MITKGAPHVIHDDEELEAYTNALFRLTALENPADAEQEAIELLTLLIERYEETSYPIPNELGGMQYQLECTRDPTGRSKGQ